MVKKNETYKSHCHFNINTFFRKISRFLRPNDSKQSYCSKSSSKLADLLKIEENVETTLKTFLNNKNILHFFMKINTYQTLKKKVELFNTFCTYNLYSSVHY